MAAAEEVAAVRTVDAVGTVGGMEGVDVAVREGCIIRPITGSGIRTVEVGVVEGIGVGVIEGDGCLGQYSLYRVGLRLESLCEVT